MLACLAAVKVLLCNAAESVGKLAIHPIEMQALRRFTRSSPLSCALLAENGNTTVHAGRFSGGLFGKAALPWVCSDTPAALDSKQ
jgi:hypothetical protein